MHFFPKPEWPLSGYLTILHHETAVSFPGMVDRWLVSGSLELVRFDLFNGGVNTFPVNRLLTFCQCSVTERASLVEDSDSAIQGFADGNPAVS